MKHNTLPLQPRPCTTPVTSRKVAPNNILPDAVTILFIRSEINYTGVQAQTVPECQKQSSCASHHQSISVVQTSMTSRVLFDDNNSDWIPCQRVARMAVRMNSCA
jgi:hypothetical protein